ncbi:hypothetical protein G4X40_10085 [Rhodococcus sp. D2-41]|uniref:DUF5926 family protein n=1 Tax=Speluncibacter jeojiensis TaxID=2710754 RepID=UPI00240EFC0D|nr:DUF5926 family protein [Rhodococcus sp. D2-41]MDG3010495.1 hypothetical protein [Rhodococcus sp. D2-41]
MGKKSKRNSGPRPGSNRAELMERRRLERAEQPETAARPLQGLAAECDLVALREFVPSATATLTVADTVAAERPLVVSTVLPGAVAALVREQGPDDAGLGMVAMQVQAYSGDLGADLAASVLWAAGASVGETLTAAGPTAQTPPVTEVLAADRPLEITVHNDFNWWIPEGVQPAPEVQAAVDRANEVMLPTALLQGEGIESAWWVDAGDKAHLRWVRPEDEDELMSALARVHAAGGLTLGDGSRFAGSFRTHGLLVPVFDLDPERHPDEWIPATAEFGRRLQDALAVTTPLTPEERRSRDGIRGRQITLR